MVSGVNRRFLLLRQLRAAVEKADVQRARAILDTAPGRIVAGKWASTQVEPAATCLAAVAAPPSITCADG